MERQPRAKRPHTDTSREPKQQAISPGKLGTRVTSRPGLCMSCISLLVWNGKQTFDTTWSSSQNATI